VGEWVHEKKVWYRYRDKEKKKKVSAGQAQGGEPHCQQV
jgi:hypothetical protein